MVRLREVQRTAAFTWSPGPGKPILVTGTRAGAVDDDFSAESKLELWDLNLDGQESAQELSPIISLNIDSRFYDVAWGPADPDHPAGIIAGALENGSLDLWDAERLLNGQLEAALISRTTKHTGPIKALQFNPQRPHIIATAGFKGELFVYDTNEPSNAFRLGTAAARADDLECLAWNRIVPHILATGGAGGFVMVWDLKTKKASWTLNNRKPVSAIAWDPNNSTKLLVATPDDSNPAILLWDLRNSNAPERTLEGHGQGILSLSWCSKDSDLLLSCGKDNKTMMWNPQTGERYGEFPESTNWTFSTSFNPHNPSIIATASFDGKIVVQTVQNTNASASQATADSNLDGEEFFSATQPQPLGPSFTLAKAPSWLARPVGASFGFGGKLVVFRPATAQAGQKKTSQLSISQFSVDSDVGSATEGFENRMESGEITGICKDRADKARTEDEKADWLVMETLAASNPRERIPGYLGFQKEPGTNGAKGEAGESTDKLAPAKPRGHAKRASFFGITGDLGSDSDDFLSATKGVKTDNPFHLLSDGDTTIEKEITQALLLGDFTKATDLCLQEGRMTDAFLIANCGGPELVEKVQAAYLTQKEGYPSYLRLLGSVLEKNLWDVVYNASLSDWKEAMVVLCTYSDNSEFPDLCEALGDRILEKGDKKDASFCYLVGSKLEKVVSIWVAELEEAEKAGVEDTVQGSTFSVHARYLQHFIEKVTVFRHVTNFQDDERELLAGWKLAPLYDKYTEYADIVAAHGQLAVAEKYLDLLPNKYPAAEVARNRVRLATQKTAAPQVPPAKKTPIATARAPSRAPSIYQQTQQAQQAQATQPPQYGQTVAPSSNSYAPQGNATPAFSNPYALHGSAAPASSNPYAPPGANTYQPPGAAPNPYQPATSAPYAPTHGGYQPPHASTSVPGYGGAPAAATTPSVAPPSQSKSMDNWNDVPLITKAPPRRNTPSVAPVTSPFPGQHNAAAGPPQSPYIGSGMGSPVPPPPKAPPRVTSPRSDPHVSFQQPTRPASTTAPSSYVPPPPSQGSVPPTMAPQMASRTGSPYNAPPSVAGAPQSNRYAPALAQQQSQTPVAGPPGGIRPPPPANPYGSAPPNQFAPSPYASTHGPPTGQASGPCGIPPPGPNAGPIPGPPPQGPPKASAPQPTPPPPKAAWPQQAKHPAGDRSHLTPEGRKIFELFEGDFRNVAAKAPPTFFTHVKDTEKRLNFLFDHLNNGELLAADTIDQLGQLAEALTAKNYDEAHRLQLEIQKNKTEECGNWMVGVKRLITLSKNTL